MPEIAPKNCDSYLAVWQHFFEVGDFVNCLKKIGSNIFLWAFGISGV